MLHLICNIFKNFNSYRIRERSGSVVDSHDIVRFGSHRVHNVYDSQ